MKKILHFNKFYETYLSFSYKGDKLPNEEMINWYEMETRHIDDSYDDLEIDIEYSKIQKDFFEKFSEELSELSYFEMLDVFIKLY